MEPQLRKIAIWISNVSLRTWRCGSDVFVGMLPRLAACSRNICWLIYGSGPKIWLSHALLKKLVTSAESRRVFLTRFCKIFARFLFERRPSLTVCADKNCWLLELCTRHLVFFFFFQNSLLRPKPLIGFVLSLCNLLAVTHEDVSLFPRVADLMNYHFPFRLLDPFAPLC